jgi:hypothetical protein
MPRSAAQFRKEVQLFPLAPAGPLVRYTGAAR